MSAQEVKIRTFGDKKGAGPLGTCSVIFGEENGRCRPIPLCNDPKLGPEAVGIGREKPFISFKTGIVRQPIFPVYFPPVSGDMPIEGRENVELIQCVAGGPCDDHLT